MAHSASSDGVHMCWQFVGSTPTVDTMYALRAYRAKTVPRWYQYLKNGLCGSTTYGVYLSSNFAGRVRLGG